MEKPQALYIHIPFCNRICTYCDFPKLLSSTGFIPEYLKALKRELETIPQGQLKTIFLGGGTPSVLNEEELEELLSYLQKSFSPSVEFTLEANPESLSESKIKILKKNGVNRVSLGVQSFDKEILKILGREERTEEETINCVNNLKSNGIKNINLDFIYGLKKEKREELRREIELASSLDVSHISAYSLQVEKNTPLFYQKDVVKDDDGLASDYDFLRKVLKEHGYERYEVSNFAKNGFESKHNLTYWHGDPYYAAGLGATSYVEGVRATRTRNIKDYIAGEKLFISKEKEDLSDQEFDFLMLNLRLEDGFSLKEFHDRFQKDFLKAYEVKLQECKYDLVISSKRVRVKKSLIYVLDQVLLNLLDFDKETK
ncbi:MAG: radical SAM family heme chaperone HemW [Bacilli bacterium]|jgi:oxygen-independent coproporphyrinogen-3 oxidase|nr:radical SAM family heme chaperone HemW [Bacilli bacterium]